MLPFIDLQRQFRTLTSSEIDELDRPSLLESVGETIGMGWSNLLAHRRVVLLAEAGSGKTREMQEQAARLTADGHFAVFIRLEELARELLVSPDEERRLVEWKAEGRAPGYFFLDAVDELKLSEGTLDRALLRLAREIHGHLDRAHVVVSCRPNDWRRGADLAILEQRLAISARAPLPQPASSEEVFLAALRRGAGAAPAAPAPAPAGATSTDVQTVVLLPLRDLQIQLFAERMGVGNAGAFLAEIARRNAWTFARRPLDLIDLAEAWLATGSLGRRADQHEANVAAKLRDDPGRRDRGVLSDAEARQGAERLALALVITRTRTLRSPDQAIAPERLEGVLDPAEVLPDWSEEKRQTLLRRALFDPATHGRVRFHHRSVQEYLAARHLKELRDRGMPIKALLRLLVATHYGVEVVIPSMRPIAAWLALWVREVRDTLMQREPEALLLFGDPESLSIDVRSRLLTRFVEAYGEGGWRGLDVPLDEVRRLAHSDLAPVVRRLWGNNPANPDVRNLLIEMIWQGPIRACADLAREGAFNVAWDPYSRIVAVRALIACGEANTLQEIAADMMAQPDRWPDRVVFSVAEELFPDILGLDDLVALMRRTREPRNTVGGFGWAARMIVEKIDPLSPMAARLRDALSDVILQGRAADLTFYEIRGSFDHLAPSLAILCRRQLDGIREAPDAALIRAAVVASRFGKDEAGLREAVGQLRSRFTVDADRRSAAFWAELAFLDELVPAQDAWDRLYHVDDDGLLGHVADPDQPWLEAALADPDHPERHTVALQALLIIWQRRGRLEADLDTLRAQVLGRAELEAILEDWVRPRPVNEEHEQRERERQRRQRQAAFDDEQRLGNWRTWRDELLADPDEALSPAKRRGAIGNLHLWLQANKRSQGRYNVWDEAKVIEAFGDNVVGPIRAAFQEHWRATMPLAWSQRPADERNSTPHFWIQGLCGVSAEAETPGWAAGLSPDEARLATVYSMQELNGFAAFLPDLVAGHPAEVEEVLGSELSAELAEGAHHSYLPVLQNLSNAEPNLKRLLAPRLLTAVPGWPQATTEDEAHALAHHLDTVLRVLAETVIGQDRQNIVTECEARLRAGFAGPVGRAWLKGLFRLDAERGVEALAAGLGPAAEPEARSQAVTIFAALFGHEGIAIDGLDAAVRARVLGRLVRTAYAFVQPADDIHHEGTYSPDQRDDAQHARNALLTQLIDAPGSEARQALLDLAHEPDFAHLADRLHLLARQRAATDAEFPAYAVGDVLALERHHEAPPHDRDGLFTVMLDRLDDLQHDLSHGDFTERRTLQRIEHEAEMQAILAGRLRAMANGAYTVTREPEVADNKLPDIQLAAVRGGQRAVAELKIANSWSPADLEHALEHQLLGQYLRHEGCKGGCLLLTDNGTRGWNHPVEGGRISFQELVAYLNGRAQLLEERSAGGVRLGVVGLDLTDPPLVPAHR